DAAHGHVRRASAFPGRVRPIEPRDHQVRGRSGGRRLRLLDRRRHADPLIPSSFRSPMKRLLSLLLLGLLAALSCTKKVTQAGGLELMLMSDLPASDLTRVHLEISQEAAPGEWHKVFDREQLVPQEVSLPTTA